MVRPNRLVRSWPRHESREELEKLGRNRKGVKLTEIACFLSLASTCACLFGEVHPSSPLNAAPLDIKVPRAPRFDSCGLILALTAAASHLHDGSVCVAWKSTGLGAGRLHGSLGDEVAEAVGTSPPSRQCGVVTLCCLHSSTDWICPVCIKSRASLAAAPSFVPSPRAIAPLLRRCAMSPEVTCAHIHHILGDPTNTIRIGSGRD